MTPQELAARGIRVKGLEWEERLNEQASAALCGWPYLVRWLPGGRFALGTERFSTLEAAKAAAEADNAARIAAQLEPQP